MQRLINKNVHTIILMQIYILMNYNCYYIKYIQFELI